MRLGYSVVCLSHASEGNQLSLGCFSRQCDCLVGPRLLPVFPPPFVSITTIPKSLSSPTWRARWQPRERGLPLSSLVLLRKLSVTQSMAAASCPLLPCKRWPCSFSVTQGDLSPDSWVRPWQPAINKFYCLHFAFVQHQHLLHCQ